MIRLRASSLADFADCQARWAARNLEGQRLPSSGAAWLGTALHRSTGAYDLTRLAHGSASIDETAGVLVDSLRRPDEDVSWGDDSPREAERIGLTLHSRYCAEVAPARDYAGVEVACDSLTVDVGGIVLDLTGTTDRIRRTPSGLGISDIKSGKRAVNADGTAVTKGHGLQVALYELLAERAIGQFMAAPAEIVGLQTSAKPAVGTGLIESHRDVLIGTAERPGLLDAVANAMRTGIFVGNARSQLCSAKYCPAWVACRWRD